MDAAALLCNICPKRPKFSDVSHLLTHVASKAHLSHYFKLQVRSHQEPQAEVLLDDYNEWYKANNLAKLLSDRMSSKDSRRKKSLGKNPVPDRVPHQEGDEGQDVTPLQAYNPRNSLPAYIDPRLSDPFVNSDIATGRGRVPMLSPHDQVTNAIPSQWKQDDGDDTGNEEPSTPHATPCWSRTFRTQKDRRTQSTSGPFIYDPFVDDNDSFECSNPGEMDKDRADEIARLKGVLWPGMDIFDSATEQMKRKRNQKKDESILKKMERTSMGVEPTELVFSPTGILRKQRVISGNVEDSSPLKGETPIPKKRATRPKRVLVQMDPNAQRAGEGKRGKKSIKRDADSLGGNAHQHDMFPRPATVPGFGQHGGQFPVSDDMEEIALALRDHDFKPHNKFAVFRDIPALREPKLEGQHTYFHGDPVASQSVFLRREIAIHDNPNSPRSAGHASTLLERASHPTAKKENVEPLLNVYGRLDPLVGWHSPAMKRADRGLSPHYLFGEAQYVGYSPFKCHGSPTVYSFNPLAGSLAKLAADENPIYAGEPGYAMKAPSEARVGSPDATISEVEDDDFDHLYLDGNSC
ncbi:hypothetical protein ASPCAL08318 [Aspergillus calidoustus]|uniref:Uncharacterized protein n=1 Tax=Aspergillus calidoustus TaxID=454130 RepID=A0A0U5GWJ9_ASPCI|nr:hypothetical protein ASPCAL08318 [Aspergillus calidoustus]